MRGTNGALARACALACALAACGGAGSTGAVHPGDHPGASDGTALPYVIAGAPGIFAIARDDQWLYWATPEGLHRRKLDLPEADDGKGELFATPAKDEGFPPMIALAAGGGHVIGTDGNTVYTFAGGGASPRAIARDLDDVVDVALAGDTVVIARRTAIAKVPFAGGAVITLATRQTHVIAVAADADHVYWSDYGEEPQSPPPPPDSSAGAGTIRRVALAGGKIEELAPRQRGPGSVALSGGRVYWTCDRLPAVQSAQPDGKDRKIEVTGVADRLAVDDAGTVSRTPGGYLLEASRGHRAMLRAEPDGTFVPQAIAPVLTRDWIYLLATRSMDGSTALLAIPRSPAAPTIAIGIAGMLTRLRARDGALVWLENRRDGGGVSVWRGDPKRGQRKALTSTMSQWPNDLAIGGDGSIYLSQDQSLFRLDARGGELRPFAMSSNWISAIAVHHDHVFWVDGAALMAKRRTGGEPITVARSPQGYSNGDSGGDIVFDDDFAYISNFGSTPGLARISESGAIDALWNGGGGYPGRDVVKVGDDLYAWAGNTVYRIALDGAAPSSLYHLSGSGGITDLVAGGGYLFVAASFGEYWEVVRIDPATGDGHAVLRWRYGGADQGLLAADDSGVYVGIDVLGAILHAPLDAPALPPVGWPKP
jgi:hypothetical protein